MCYTVMNQAYPKVRMNKETFDKIADKFFSKTRMLYLSCGAEPLVNPKFTDFINSSSKYGIGFRSFATNGMLLDKKVINACVDNQIEEVIISLDGSTKETVESIRIGSDFNRITKNLTNLDQAITESSKEFPKIRINCTLMRSNFHELEKTIRHYSNFKNVYVIDVRHMRVHEELDMDNEALTNNEQQEYENIVKKMEKHCRERNILLQYPKKCFVEPTAPSSNQFCPIPYFSIYVDSKGEVRLCPYVKEGVPIESFELLSNRAIQEYVMKQSPSCSNCETKN